MRLLSVGNAVADGGSVRGSNKASMIGHCGTLPPLHWEIITPSTFLSFLRSEIFWSMLCTWSIANASTELSPKVGDGLISQAAAVAV